MRNLIAEAPAAVSACQPSQRSLLLDERRVALDDLPLRNLIRAVVGFEQAQSPTDLTRVAMALGEWLATPTDHEIGRAFADWIAQLTRRMGTGDEMPPLGGAFEETTMSLADRVAQWPEQCAAKAGQRNAANDWTRSVHCSNDWPRCASAARSVNGSSRCSSKP